MKEIFFVLNLFPWLWWILLLLLLSFYGLGYFFGYRKGKRETKKRIVIVKKK